MRTEIRGYKIQERIGLGGMGEVYKAFHPGLNRIAAVKFLFQKEHADRFKNEAYIQSSVNHPNIAKLYEYVVDGDTPCIIMEYVEGSTLDSYILRHGKIGSTETEKILAQIVSALKYLHARNIIHRDIKPQNFKVGSDGTVKMLDFGISKNEYTPKLTQLGFVVGTTEYMAPEQFEHKVELKSDIWSLGVMAYEMLTGHLPFESNNPISLRTQIVKAKFTDPKILVPQISEKLSEVIGKSLKTSPSHRASAQEIEELLVGKEVVKKVLPEKPPGELKRFNKAINERYSNIPGQRKLIYGGVLVVVALVIIISFSRKSSPEPGPVNNPGDTAVFVDKPIINSPVDKTKLSSVKIAVSNAADVEVVLPDASRKPVPIELTGKVGESYDVILKADGYIDKPVHISFLPTQTIYTYNLDKKTDE